MENGVCLLLLLKMSILLVVLAQWGNGISVLISNKIAKISPLEWAKWEIFCSSYIWGQFWKPHLRCFLRQAKLSEKPVLKDYRLSFRVIQIYKVAHHFQLYCNVFIVSWDFQWNTAPRTQVYNSFLLHPKSYWKENTECKQANKQGQKKTQIIAKTYYFNKWQMSGLLRWLKKKAWKNVAFSNIDNEGNFGIVAQCVWKTSNLTEQNF